jgi:hypothetical protein
MEQIDSQIQFFLEMTNLPEHSVVSVAVDAMAWMLIFLVCLQKKSDFAFVIFAQLLDRRYRYLPRHVMRHESGQVIPDVQAAITEVCEALWRHQVVVIHDKWVISISVTSLDIIFYIETSDLYRDQGLYRNNPLTSIWKFY